MPTIDDAIQTWRQGDCVLEDGLTFVHRVEASPNDADAGDLLETPVDGLIVLTQTCDLVRTHIERPFVEVSPLVVVEEEVLQQVRRGRRPALAFVPPLEPKQLVADLDRVMTIDKAVLAGWGRVVGWNSDAELRQFAAALSRKRARFAFPDDFVEVARSLQSRLTAKHDKQTAEGRALQALREIRVRAEPSWDASEVQLELLLIRDEDEDVFEGAPWSSHIETWEALVAPSGRFGSVAMTLTTLSDMTAADYVGSDPLDLDHLSSRGGAPR